MPRLRRFLSLSLLLIPLGAAAAAPEAFPGLNRKWRYYESPNFELYSTRSDGVSRGILQHMELLHALFLDTFKLPVRLPQPVTIFAFESRKDFEGYLPPERRGSTVYDGFCLAHADRTVITLAPTEDEENIGKVVYHEYIHRLFVMAEEYPPPWFNEGVAELFSTMTKDRDWLMFGAPIPGRVYELKYAKLMPLGQLFAVTYDSPLFRESDHTGLFYSESWALLHYLEFGVNKFPPEKVDMFLRAATSLKAQEYPAAFRELTRELLGVDYPQLEHSLDQYVRSGTFNGRKVRQPAIKSADTYAVRPALPEEMTLRLAELSLRFTRSAYANLTIRNQLSRQPDARLHELLGSVALLENEPDVARENWQRAFELGTNNVATFRELSRLEANLVFSQFNLDYRLPEDRAALLRSLLGKSIERAPQQSAGYEMLAWVEATAQQPDIRAVNEVQKHFNSLKDKPRTLLALVVVRMRLGQADAAKALLGELAKLEPNDWVQYCAEVTRARLENRPIDPERLPKGMNNRSGVIRIPAPKLDLPH